MEKFLGQKVIVRGNRSGVFFGTLAERNGTEVRLENCRRIWSWKGAASISQLAAEGPQFPEGCKFTMFVDEIEILDAIEINPCTVRAINSIENVKIWKI